jgi:hypothetical protein
LLQGEKVFPETTHQKYVQFLQSGITMIIGPSVLTTRHMNLSQSTSINDRVKNVRPFIMSHVLIFLIGESHKVEISSYQNW